MQNKKHNKEYSLDKGKKIMGENINQVIAGLSKERQDRINARAAELIAEELTMRDLRKAMDMTQKELAKKMHKQQDEISRLEARSDILLSTLKKFVGALGGELALVAEFPNRDPVVLAGFGCIENEEVEDKSKKVAKKKPAARRKGTKTKIAAHRRVAKKKASKEKVSA